jgi:hypothetical protein
MVTRFASIVSRRFATKDPVTTVLQAPVSAESFSAAVTRENDFEQGKYLKDPDYVAGSTKEELRVGAAQTLRVNNPYRYIEADKFGRSVYDAEKDVVGVYKGAEYGGSNASNAGAMHALLYEETCSPTGFWQKQRTARIRVEIQSKMQSVP